MESQSQLVEFMTDISLDPERLMAFLADPAAAMQTADLSAEDIEALTSKNRHAVFARVTGIRFDENDPLAAYIPAFSTFTNYYISTFE